MKDKIKRELSRRELADYLEELAAQLRHGTFEAYGRRWSIPDKLEAKIRFKEKRGHFDTKLKWRWSTFDEYEPGAREDVLRWKGSFKALKKRLNDAFKELQQTVGEDRIPDEKAVTDFIEASRVLAQFAEPEWQEAMDEYLDHLGSLKYAVEKRELEMVRHELRDLKVRMQACHRDYI
ncbi:MAG: GAK system XXXCH domain-containing protein [Desulfobacterales bacterium]|nr:MAG: GAK system XXXCH domain-containing protein [Desulfobacterales bacterium]